MISLNMIERLVTELTFNPPDEDMGVKETLLTEFLDEIDGYYSVVYEGLDPEEIYELNAEDRAALYAERYMSNVLDRLNELADDISRKVDLFYQHEVNHRIISEYVINSKQFKKRQEYFLKKKTSQGA